MVSFVQLAAALHRRTRFAEILIVRGDLPTWG
jgi:hypothetical protein